MEHTEVRRATGFIPLDLFIRFKAETVRRNISMAHALAEAIRLWLASKTEPPTK